MGLSAERSNHLQLIRASARDFAETQIRPYFMEWNEARDTRHMAKSHRASVRWAWIWGSLALAECSKNCVILVKNTDSFHLTQFIEYSFLSPTYAGFASKKLI